MKALLTSALFLATVLTVGAMNATVSTHHGVLRLADVMTSEELEETGLMTLTAPQRAALDRWVTVHQSRTREEGVPARCGSVTRLQ